MKVEGQSLNEVGDNWVVNCPLCDVEIEYEGFYDSYDENECRCGCIFKTNKVWLNDDTYIQ